MAMTLISENNSYTQSKPNDFSEFWDRCIQKVFEIPVQYQIIPASFSSPIANCYDLFFTSIGGAIIHAVYIKPKNAPAKSPTLLMFHGYTWNSSGYSQKLPYVSLGYTVLAMDCRGQGGFSVDQKKEPGNTVFGHIVRGIEGDPENLYYVDTYLDTIMLTRVAQELDDVDPDYICAIGDSQGGALALLCASLQPEIKRVICYYPFLCDFQQAIQQPGPTAYEEIKQYFKRVDPLHLHEKEIFKKLAYIDIQHFADRIQSEVLWLMGGSDTLCPPITQFSVYDKINSRKEILIYPEYGHEIMPDSYDKIYQFLQR